MKAKKLNSRILFQNCDQLSWYGPLYTDSRASKITSGNANTVLFRWKTLLQLKLDLQSLQIWEYTHWQDVVISTYVWCSSYLIVSQWTIRYVDNIFLFPPVYLHVVLWYFSTFFLGHLLVFSYSGSFSEHCWLTDLDHTATVKRMI